MRALLVTLAIVLAGCSAAPSEPVAASEHDLVVTATTGILRCLVVDEAINPIEGAMVIIAGQVQHTEADGLCGADGLQPGNIQVHASKRGHAAALVVAAVEAGVATPDQVRIVLPVDPETVPYTQSFKHDAHIACSTTWTSACGHQALSGQTQDSSTTTIALDGAPFHLAVEAAWTSTQPLGDDLLVVVGAGEPTGANAYQGLRGASPIQMTFGPMDGRAMRLHEQDLHVRLYASEANGTQRPCTPPPIPNCYNGVGLVLQQDVEVFVHAFHHWTPGADWRFSRDGDPSPA